jgi:hypothetical protein
LKGNENYKEQMMRMVILSCYNFFLPSRGINIPVTGTMPKTKARKSVQAFYFEHFSASNRWLKSLKTLPNNNFISVWRIGRSRHGSRRRLEIKTAPDIK